MASILTSDYLLSCLSCRTKSISHLLAVSTCFRLFDVLWAEHADKHGTLHKTLWRERQIIQNVRRTRHTLDDVTKGKHFPHYWPFVWGIHRSPVNSPHKGQWRGALMFSLICAWTNSWVNNRDAGDLRRHRAHYDVTVMCAWFGALWCGFVKFSFGLIRHGYCTGTELSIQLQLCRDAVLSIPGESNTLLTFTTPFTTLPMKISRK